jgi:hypothetical protein
VKRVDAAVERRCATLLAAKIAILLHYRLNKWGRNKQFLAPVKQSNRSEPAGVRGECRLPPDASLLLKNMADKV